MPRTIAAPPKGNNTQRTVAVYPCPARTSPESHDKPVIRRSGQIRVMRVGFPSPRGPVQSSRQPVRGGALESEERV
jgi:hypothetical protein